MDPVPLRVNSIQITKLIDQVIMASQRQVLTGRVYRVDAVDRGRLKETFSECNTGICDECQQDCRRRNARFCMICT
eukprot:5654198-Karenia_brevis.AAC.1